MGHGSNRVDRMVELEIRDRLVVDLLLVDLLLVVNLDRRVMEMAMVEVTMV